MITKRVREWNAMEACIYLSGQALVPALEREVFLFVVGHPSKYASRDEWPDVLSALRNGLQESGVAPISKTKALVKLEPILAYGYDV